MLRVMRHQKQVMNGEQETKQIHVISFCTLSTKNGRKALQLEM